MEAYPNIDGLWVFRDKGESSAFPSIPFLGAVVLPKDRCRPISNYRKDNIVKILACGPSHEALGNWTLMHTGGTRFATKGL